MLRPILPVLNYYVDYDYIIAELCENKDKPVLQCNGKCHLAKELKKANDGIDQEQTAPPLNMKEYPVAPFFAQTILPQKTLFITYNKIINSQLNLFIDTYYCSIFQPPRFIT